MKLRSFALAATMLPLSIHAGYFGPLLSPENATFPENACAIHLIHTVRCSRSLHTLEGVRGILSLRA